MDPDEKEIEIRLKEYEALRNEILTQIRLYYQLLAIFYGGIFLLIGAILQYGNRWLFLIIPFIVFVVDVYAIRLEFYIRLLGEYIRNNIDININNLFNKTIMGWETYYHNQIKVIPNISLLNFILNIETFLSVLISFPTAIIGLHEIVNKGIVNKYYYVFIISLLFSLLITLPRYIKIKEGKKGAF